MTAQPERRPPALFPEGVVADRFRIVCVLGVGGTGTVFEAIDEQTGVAVALKAIPRDERLHRRARREMRVAQTLDHPAIVKLLHTAEDADYVYVVFELVRGSDLAHAFREAALDDTAVLRAVAAVCDALSHAHERGVVHRDVKPGNVLLRDADGVLKLTDFGIALVDHPDATIDDRLLGTLSYMAPEQALGRDVDGAADVWAAALMLFEALAGHNPYRARTPRELADRQSSLQISLAAERPDLPAVALRFVDRALGHDPRKRPSAAELRDALLTAATARERGERRTSSSGSFTLDERPVAARRFRHLRARLGASWRRLRPAGLRLVAAPGDGGEDRRPAAAYGARLLAAASALAAREGVAQERRAPLARVGSAVLTGLLVALALGALPFYPNGYALGFGLALALLALRRPLLAYCLALALVVPLAGNLADGLVPIVVIGGGLWAVLASRFRRAIFVPALALPAVALGGFAFYLLGIAQARSRFATGALGAAGPVMVALVCGIGGWSSPLTGSPPAAGLTAAIAESSSAIGVTGALWDAVGATVLAQAVAWGALALAARPLAQLEGAPLRWYASLWLSAGCALTVLSPALVGGTPGPLGPIAVGCAAAGILLGLRSTVVRQGGDPPAAAGAAE